jgi:hypothetical protein
MDNTCKEQPAISSERGSNSYLFNWISKRLEIKMSWVLYIILGSAMPILQQVNRYTDETVCKQAVKELTDKNVRAVCLPRQE